MEISDISRGYAIANKKRPDNIEAYTEYNINWLILRLVTAFSRGTIDCYGVMRNDSR